MSPVSVWSLHLVTWGWAFSNYTVLLWIDENKNIGLVRMFRIAVIVF